MNSCKTRSKNRCHTIESITTHQLIVLYELRNDDTVGIKAYSNVECHLLFELCLTDVLLLLFYVNIVTQWDGSE